MDHYESFDGRGFLFVDSFTVFRGSNGIQVVFRSSLHFGTPENRHYFFIFHFIKTSCRRMIQRNPQSFVVKLDQNVLEFSCSRRGRPQNAILVHKSNSLRFHRGTAKFIALIGKTSRRFEKLGPELLHKCSMDHYAKSYGGGFSIFFFIFDLGGSDWRAFPQKSLGPPKNGLKSQKGKKKTSIGFFVMVHRTSVQNFRI